VGECKEKEREEQFRKEECEEEESEYEEEEEKDTFMPLVSSSSNEPISNASAALTSPRGGMRGGGYFCK